MFLAPKMYSIKNRHTHVKGVKLDFVSHEDLGSCLRKKQAGEQAGELMIYSALQFIRRDYNILLRGVDKTYTL